MDESRGDMGFRRSRIHTEIDFNLDGRQCGFLSIPVSIHESAYGRIQVPVVCLKNGDGPTALLLAGNHGDEYEGQIALIRLIQTLRPPQIRGRVVVLPAANLPAVTAARRASPLDGGNLNRSFPGDPDGTPTEMMAHYLENVLLPMADYAVDLHSGGSSLVYLPCTLIRDDDAADQAEKTFAAMEAFGGKIAYVTDGRNQGAERTFHAAAARTGAVAITTELGGAATVDAEGLQLAEEGIRRLLHHGGILTQAPPVSEKPPRLMAVESPRAYVLAPENGIFEPSVTLGSDVKAEDLAGWIHYPETPWRESTPVHFQISGYVICRRAIAQTQRGDCLYQLLASYWERSSLQFGGRRK